MAKIINPINIDWSTKTININSNDTDQIKISDLYGYLKDQWERDLKIKLRKKKLERINGN